MINFKLNQENFNHLKTEYKIVEVNLDTFPSTYWLIFDAIEHFNHEIVWDGMFDFYEAHKRISNGMKMYIGTIDDEVFGYVWFKNEKDGRSLFNLFVRNQVEDKKHTGKEFVSDVICRYENNMPIYSEVDEWNVKSIKLFLRLGFQVQ